MKKLIFFLPLLIVSCVEPPEVQTFDYQTNLQTKITNVNGNNITVTDSKGDTVCSVNNQIDFTLNSTQNISVRSASASDKESVVYYPSQNEFATFMMEDMYPNCGDYDFNDLVVNFRLKYNLNKSNKVTSIDITYKVKASGYGENGSGFAMMFLNPAAQYLYPQTFWLVAYDKELKPYANTVKGKEVNFTTKTKSIVFDKPCPMNIVTVEQIAFVSDVQMKGCWISPPMYNFNYHPLDTKGMPFALVIPADFDYPMERVNINAVYPKFKSWRESYGKIDKEWWIK